MPDYVITDPLSKRQLHVSGPTEPTQREAHTMFKQISPQSIMGAPEGMLSAGLEHLVQHPGQLGGVWGAMKNEGRQIAMGEPPSTPSGKLGEMGVNQHPGLPGFIMDTLSDPMNAVVAGESVPENIAKNLMEHTPQLFGKTRKLYTRIVEDVLSQMNRPVEAPQVLKLVEKAGVGSESAVTGFTKWLKAQGRSYVSRVKIIKRLLQEEEFHQILSEHAPANLRGVAFGSEMAEQAGEAVPGVRQAMAEHPMWKAVLSIAGALGGLAPDWHQSGRHLDQRMRLQPGTRARTIGGRIFDAEELTGAIRARDAEGNEVEDESPHGD